MRYLPPLLFGLGILLLFGAVGALDFHDLMVEEIGADAVGPFHWGRFASFSILGLVSLTLGVWGLNCQSPRKRRWDFDLPPRDRR